MAQRNRLPEDLDPYTGAPDEEILGLAPLAVGFLRRNAPFPTGQTPALFRARLLDFCLPEHTLQVVATPLACGLGCGRVAPFTFNEHTIQLGLSEIRVLGDDDIFAAPTLIYHYVTAHNYRPPDEFIQAVLKGPAPGSPEHRALLRTLNRG
ncbi:MAG: hypothetical protein KA314_01705 [Chloroflexi bacterium]|nr:hypothetical protein [Chloroflexota bacterium]MBP8054523.1 hypothetical protein [Chloroflexota bacterium]